MENGFNLEEAREMLGLAYAADLLGPAGFKKETIDWKKDYSNDENNPLKTDDGKTHAYPVQIWPQGWTPGLKPRVGDQSPWNTSVIVPTVLKGAIEGMVKKILKDHDKIGISALVADQLINWIDKEDAAHVRKMLGANNVVVTYNEKRNAYAISFAGTQNKIGGMQDLLFVPVSARELHLGQFKSTTTYMYEPVAEPEQLKGTVHLGFRLALEQFTVNAATGESLTEALIQLNKQKRGKDAQGRLRVYVTGHSLGAAMASLFTAWLQANHTRPEFLAQHPGFPTLDIKMYTFATPKTGNNIFVKAFNMGLTNANKAFHVDNHLDAVPDIPFTVQLINDLSNSEMLLGMLSKEEVAEAEATENLTDEELEQQALETASPEKKKQWLKILALRALKITGKTIMRVLKHQDYAHPGFPIHLRGKFPRTNPDAKMDRHFFPGLAPDEEVPDSDKITKLWWQHWPWVYRDALDETFAE